MGTADGRGWPVKFVIYVWVCVVFVLWLIVRSGKGFKSEWATVKDQTLYVGSMGKEWSTGDGVFQNYNPMFVKAVTTKGEVCNCFDSNVIIGTKQKFLRH